MQGTDAEGVDWGGMAEPEAAATWSPEEYPGTKAPVIYPEYPALPEAPISINFRPGDKPQITVRGHSAAQITAALNELEAGGVYANIAAAMASLNAQGPLGAGLGPVSPVGPPAAPQAPAAPQFGAAPGPATPPPFGPNVSVPNAPGYQAPAQGGFPPPQQGGWGGNQQQRSQEKPRPAGWLMVDVPFPDKDRFKAMREAGKDYFKGKVQWGGRGVYWLEPSVAQYVAQQGFPVTQ